MSEFDFRAYLARQREWALATFGPGQRVAGVLDHIRKELLEIEEHPEDLLEWVDLMILAYDGAMRQGYQPKDIIEGLKNKQFRNESRRWPDYRTMDPDKAIEHIRTDEQ